MSQSLLEIYQKHLEVQGYKHLNTSVVDGSSKLNRKIEYWGKDVDKIIIEILDENICFLYKEFIFEKDSKLT